MGVPRGTTPTFVLTFTEQNLDLTQANHVYVTLEQRGKILTKTGGEITVEAKRISVYLSQQETLAFGIGDIKIQANWTMTGGGRCASEVVVYPLSEQLLQKVVE